MGATLENHHRDALNQFLQTYATDETIQAIPLVGSIAHGLASHDSDKDLCLVVTPEEFSRRKKANTLAFSL